MRNWNPDGDLACLVLWNLTYPEHRFHRWGNRPLIEPGVHTGVHVELGLSLTSPGSWVQLLSTTQHYIFQQLPLCRFIFHASESYSSLAKPPIPSSSACWEQQGYMSKWAECRVTDTNGDCGKLENTCPVWHKRLQVFPAGEWPQWGGSFQFF